MWSGNDRRYIRDGHTCPEHYTSMFTALHDTGDWREAPGGLVERGEESERDSVQWVGGGGGTATPDFTLHTLWRWAYCHLITCFSVFEFTNNKNHQFRLPRYTGLRSHNNFVLCTPLLPKRPISALKSRPPKQLFDSVDSLLNLKNKYINDEKFTNNNRLVKLQNIK